MPIPAFAAPLVALALAANPRPAPAAPLPRSSIAAVLTHRGELGLTEAEVARLEARDAALQEQIAELRQRFAAPASSHGTPRSPEGRPATPDAGGAPRSPTAGPEPERTGGGGERHGGEPGGRHGEAKSGAPPRDPAGRAAALQSRIDDADTAAYLAAESILEAPHRERARDIAESYREALADERERSGHR